MQVSSGRPHMLVSNQRGRGKEPVVVEGRIRSFVAVNMSRPPRGHCMPQGAGNGNILQTGGSAMKTYTFKVVVEPDESGFHAYCPALRRFGAVTQGSTESEA